MLRACSFSFFQIDDIKLIRDHDTGKSHGYGFITVFKIKFWIYGVWLYKLMYGGSSMSGLKTPYIASYA